MLGHELAIEKREIARLQACHEPGERDLRRVGGAAEHAFTEEGPAQLHAIKPADQVGAVPDLDRMRVARPVERDHRMFELDIDPGLFSVRAGGNDRGEIPVAGNLEPARTDGSSQRARNMETVEWDYRAGARLDPVKLIRVAAVSHREDARRITLEKEPWVEVTHYAEITVSPAPCPAVGTGGRPCRFRRSAARSGSGA